MKSIKLMATFGGAIFTAFFLNSVVFAASPGWYVQGGVCTNDLKAVVNGCGSPSEYTVMWIKYPNRVGINTSSPDYTLDVNGTIRAKEVLIETGWSDFVFEEGYKLKSLNEVEKFIQKNKHLPDIPSASEVEEKGVSLGDIQPKLLQKVEELTLYVIELKKENEALKDMIVELKE